MSSHFIFLRMRLNKTKHLPYQTFQTPLLLTLTRKFAKLPPEDACQEIKSFRPSPAATNTQQSKTLLLQSTLEVYKSSSSPLPSIQLINTTIETLRSLHAPPNNFTILWKDIFNHKIKMTDSTLNSLVTAMLENEHFLSPYANQKKVYGRCQVRLRTLCFLFFWVR